MTPLLKKHIETPSFFKPDLKDPNFEVDLKVLGAHIQLVYEIENKVLKIRGFFIEADSLYVGCIDALFRLVDGNPVGSLNRVTAKELDFYLREDRSVPTFAYYTPEFLDLFSITSSLYTRLMTTKVDELNWNEFFELSFSEQVEYFEEFLSDEIYLSSEFNKTSFEFVDCLDDYVVISTKPELSDKQKNTLERLLRSKNDLIRIKYNS